MEDKIKIDKFELEKELKNKITLIDELETKSAQKLLNMKLEQFRKIYFIPLIILIVSSVITIATNYNDIMLYILFLSILAFVVSLISYFIIIRPYVKLLKLAKFNDKIRHEEKIRFKERKRMENVKTENANRKNIQNSIKALSNQIDTKKLGK